MNGSVTYEGSTLLSGAINVNAGGNIEALNVQVTENGTRTIEASSGVDGYSPITIETNVPIPEPELDSITITENGTYTPPSGTDGYDEITVNVPSDTPNIQSLTTTIASNGITTIHASDVNCDGFDPVTIRTEVPEPVLDSLSVTQNGTYTPPTGTDGYNEITVNVPSETGKIRPILYKEACDNDMIASHTFNSTIVTWNGGVSIGCSFNGDVSLANNNLSTLNYSITTGTCYDSVNGQNIRPLIVGVTSQIRTQPTYVSPTDAPNYFIRYKLYDVNDINKTLTDSIDLTGITGDYYIFIVATGWNFTVNNLQLI